MKKGILIGLCAVLVVIVGVIIVLGVANESTGGIKPVIELYVDCAYNTSNLRKLVECVPESQRASVMAKYSPDGISNLLGDGKNELQMLVGGDFTLTVDVKSVTPSSSGALTAVKSYIPEAERAVTAKTEITVKGATETKILSGNVLMVKIKGKWFVGDTITLSYE